MDRELIKKVLSEKVVNSGWYRYKVVDKGDYTIIKRIKKSLLDTMAEYGEWEVVWRSNDQNNAQA